MEAVADGLNVVSTDKQAVYASIKAMLTNLAVVATTLTEACKHMEVPYKDLKTALKDLEDIFPIAEVLSIAVRATSHEKKITANYFKCLLYQMKEVSLHLDAVPGGMKKLHEDCKIVHDAMNFLISNSEIFSESINVNKDQTGVVTAAERMKYFLAVIKRMRAVLERLRAILAYATQGMKMVLMNMKYIYRSVEQASVLLEHLCKCISTALKGTKDVSVALSEVFDYDD